MLRNLHSKVSPELDFTAEDIRAIMEAGPSRNYESGEVVVSQGTEGGTMFVVESGSVVAEFDSGKSTAAFGSGCFLGELSWINRDHRRSATIRATEPSSLVVLDQDVVGALLADQPHALVTLLRRTCLSLVASERNLISDLEQKNEELLRTIDFLRRTREELSVQELAAQTDELTGLYNRRCLDEQLPKFAHRATDTSTGLALIAIDLDNFKKVNDTLGHGAGDRALCSAAQVLREHLRKSDMAFRLGGDEFCILMPEITPDVARTRAEEIRRAVGRAPPPDPNSDLHVTASMGGTMLDPAEPFSVAFDRADRDVYLSKAAGRDRLHWMGKLVDGDPDSPSR